jgi:hypothetical protein
MESKASIRVVAAAGLAALAGIVGCSDDPTPGPGPVGDLELTVAYQGSLGTVDAQHPIVARLYEGLDPDFQSVPHASLTAENSPETLLFNDLATGTYTLCVIFDMGGDGLQQECPYEIHQDKSLEGTPDPVVISGDATTQLAVAFDDTRRKYPGPMTPDFALTDVNPDSPTENERLAFSSWDGARRLVYFGYST